VPGDDGLPEAAAGAAVSGGVGMLGLLGAVGEAEDATMTHVMKGVVPNPRRIMLIAKHIRFMCSACNALIPGPLSCCCMGPLPGPLSQPAL
jgi:hypothetical protein